MSPKQHRLEPRKQPRQTRAELTRQRILEAAAQVFAEYGYSAGTTNRIAERAKISIGSLYQYYPNKDAILVELMTEHLDDGMAATRSQETPETIEAIIRTFVRTAVEQHREDPRLLRVLLEQAPRAPELASKVNEHWHTRVGVVAELLRRHPEVRAERFDIAARIIVSTVELVVHHIIASDETVDPNGLEEELVAMLRRYLLPDGQPKRVT